MTTRIRSSVCKKKSILKDLQLNVSFFFLFFYKYLLRYSETIEYPLNMFLCLNKNRSNQYISLIEGATC